MSAVSTNEPRALAGTKRAASRTVEEMRPRDQRFFRELLEVVQTAFPGSDFFALDLDRRDERELVERVLWPRLERMVAHEKKLLKEVVYVDRHSGAERVVKLAFDTLRLVEKRREPTSATRADYLDQLRAEPHYALLLHSSDASETRLVFLERYLALDVLAFTYAAIGLNSLPTPPAFEAFASAAWPSRCWPSRSVRTLCRQTLPRFFADRVLRLDHWQELADKMALSRKRQSRALARSASDESAPGGKSAFDRILELEQEQRQGGAERERSVWLRADEQIRVRQSQGLDALDSASSSSSLDDNELCWSTDSARAERGAQREARRAMVELESDARRGVAQRHEYWDRLRAPGAEMRMRDRMSRTLAAALHVFVRCADESFDSKFTQVDLFYLTQLMNVERLGNELHRREPRLVSANQQASQVAAQCSEHLRSAAQRVTALPHTFLMHRLDAPHRFDYACAMSYEALYSTPPAYKLVDLLFDEVDVPALLDFVQVRGWAPARHARATLVNAKRVPLAAARSFADANALVYDAQLMDALGTETLQCALRVPLNVNRQVVGTSSAPTSSAQSAAQHSSNAVTPHSLQCSVRAALPDARDGLDFLVLYTPLSYIYSNDPRYANVGANGERFDSASPVAEMVAERAVHDASVAPAADADEQIGIAAAPTKRRRGRPSKREQLVRQRRQEIDEVRAQAAQRETLAEPALYVVLSERARAALQENAAPLVLLQRALGQGAINRHVPLCAPAVAQVLARSTNLPALCNALNALSVLIGGAPREWRPESARAARYAVRCARLVVRLVDFYASALVGRNEPLDGAAFSIFSLWRVLERHSDARAAYAAERRRTQSAKDAAALAPSFDEAFFAPLAVVLNAEQLPVAIERDAFRFLKRGCANNKRLAAHTERAAALDKQRSGPAGAERWQREPQWYVDQRRGNDGKRFTYKQRRVLEQHQESVWFAAARTRRVDERIDAKLSAGESAARALCSCGGVGVEDCAGMAREYINGASTLACCICALNHVDAAELSKELDALAGGGPLMGACSYCRTRVPWRRIDNDRLLVETHVEIGDTHEQAADERVGPLDLLEQLLAVADHNVGTPYEPHVARTVRRALSSLCFRLRRWCSAPQHPRTVHTSKQTSRFAFESYARFITEERQRGEALAADSVRLSSPAARRSFAKWRREETHRHRLRAAHRSTLDATDKLRDSAQAGVARDTARAPADALAFVLGSLEAATFVRHRTLLGVSAGLVRPEFVGTDYAESMKRALPHLVTPFTESGALHAYQRAFAQRIDAERVPLCEPALAESTAIGASAFNSLASDWRRDASAKHDHMLYNGGVPRPLTGTLPLLSELTFLNWYEPGDGEHALSDSESTLSFHGTAPPAISRSSSGSASDDEEQ